MYHMKTIVPTDERIELPKCMYRVRNIMEVNNINDTEINICEQKSHSPVMELEERQDKLLLKLDKLYERIKDISLLCKSTPTLKQKSVNRSVEQKLDKELVLVLDPEVLPWFLIVFVKGTKAINMAWHIHSNVDKKNIAKINSFIKKNQQLSNQRDSKTNVRLIFKKVASAAELIVSSLEIPIIGSVNIMRYLCLNFAHIVPYDYTDHNVEGLLDLAFLLERAPEKSKEKILNQIFSQSKNWIYKNEFSIIDLAVYNAVKQSQSLVRALPKQWYDSCEKICNI
ncbi:aminoacyl tRNA synthase complex-interacting multifunctional protein 2-like isoform X2 [Aricia agestis]|uniref:aminoacyl tRNA synthase complex-interacting multifunctional protein 2-like isoform X2 n=1 Tax=Aricia agestis TaxID=91739 RepID=UPI001C209556|nr:aminoacyl tRNA synthase complex-interacting multifunctional protein 2-like isoform X2 [Aricia agestis]